MDVLAIEGLRKDYRTPDGETVTVLDVPAFTLAAGAEVGLRGASGTGKTTLLHCIAGLLRPDEGRVVVAGLDLATLGEAARDRVRAAHVGYVFQTFNLLQGYSALENVLLAMSFAGRMDAARARALLEHVGLGDRLHHRPRQLSVGQQQRVAVARALANRPALVLADEPTGSLDAHLAATALALLRESCQAEGAALLCVSHDPAVLGAFATVHDIASVNRAAAGVPA